MTNNEAAAALSESPTLRAAAEETIEFCAENMITDTATIMEIMTKTVVRVHAEIERFAAVTMSDTSAGRTIRAAIMHEVWTSVRQGA